MTDPVEILVDAVAGALARAGSPAMVARLEAEEVVQQAMEAMGRVGVPVAHYLRRAKVYHLRDLGLAPCVIAARLSISRTQVHKDYQRELLRRRRAA